MRNIIAAAIVVGSAVPASAMAQDPTTPQQIMTGLQNVYGKHPGFRKNHAKGVCATGYFVGNAAAQAYSRSPLFLGDTIPVVTRFSIGGGDPNTPDAGRGVRGIGIEYRIPGGGIQHMTMINAPMFFTAVPRGFLENLEAATPDPKTGKPNPEAMKAFAANFPMSVVFGEYLAKHNPPPSYANTPYFGIHTFKFIGKGDKVTLVRWRFVPEDGEKELTADQMAKAPNDFLESALANRAKRGPIRWRMMVTIGQPGDAETNPTVLWPEGRKEIEAGTLSLTAAMPQQGAACNGINYDPLVMAEGIQPTLDPILLFRSPSYAASFALRLGDK